MSRPLHFFASGWGQYNVPVTTACGLTGRGSDPAGDFIVDGSDERAAGTSSRVAATCPTCLARMQAAPADATTAEFAQAEEREAANGSLQGLDCGPEVKVLARSPAKLLCWSSGHMYQSGQTQKYGDSSLFLITDRSASHYARAHLTLHHGGRLTAEMLRNCAGDIDAHFGLGATETLLGAHKAKRTLLVDGGGAKLTPSGRALRKAFAAATPDKTIAVEAACRCLQCAGPLKLETDTVRVDWQGPENAPRSLEDCQRLSNRTVVSCMGWPPQQRERVGYVMLYQTWDGESYRDRFFCSDACAAAYGRRAAAEQPALPAEPEAVNSSTFGLTPRRSRD